MKMDFHEACQKVNISPPFRKSFHKYGKNTFVPAQASPPVLPWQQRAKSFVTYCHQQLINEPEAINQLAKRGMTPETIKQFNLGWNPQTFFDQKERWDLPQEIIESKASKCQWLPRGIVIPSFNDDAPVKIKILRADWLKGGSFPKYVEVSGSRHSPSVYGDTSKPVIIVESELDALLIQQEFSHLVCCVALGGVSKKPDAQLHILLKESSLILLSLDFDEAGKKRYSFWMKQYPNVHPWPAPQTKSLGDAFQKFPVDIPC